MGGIVTRIGMALLQPLQHNLCIFTRRGHLVPGTNLTGFIRACADSRLDKNHYDADSASAETCQVFCIFSNSLSASSYATL